ncbi:hypothetical protein BGZ89_012340 [Linnemannia elongata]|nr:hypothetical protein BGZ89_012340 [Linnemannia elongata]
MASLEDIKEWNAERGKHPPLRGNYTFGGMWVGAPRSFPATLDGSPDYPIRVMFSSLSSCHLFDHETFKRGKLHRAYPYKLNYKPYRPDIDNVVIRSFHGGDPMKIHAIASVPVVIEGMLFQAENVFLVDLAPQIQTVFSMTLLDDYDMGSRATTGKPFISSTGCQCGRRGAQDFLPATEEVEFGELQKAVQEACELQQSHLHGSRQGMFLAVPCQTPGDVVRLTRFRSYFKLRVRYKVGSGSSTR